MMPIDNDLSGIINILSEAASPSAVHNMIPRGGVSTNAPAARKVAGDPETHALQAAANEAGGVKLSGVFRGFTGTSFEGRFALVISREIIPQIAQMIAAKHPHFKGVILTIREKSFFVYANGQPVNPPVEIKGGAQNVPAELARLGQPETKEAGASASTAPQEKTIESFKGFINVKTGELVNIPVTSKFNTVVHRHPEVFGLRIQGSSSFKSFQAAERNGWVPCGVNATDPNNIVVVISGLTDRHVIAAAKLLSHKVDHKLWDSLYVTSNETRKSFKRADIAKLFVPAGDTSTAEPEETDFHMLDT